MYFGVSWLDPRLVINETATEWTEVKTGPKNVSLVVPGTRLQAPSSWYLVSGTYCKEHQVNCTWDLSFCIFDIRLRTLTSDNVP